MLGKTNATPMSGGDDSSTQTYGVDLASEYMQNILDGSTVKADAVLLDVLGIGGKPAGLSGAWIYKPADFIEYMQDILTGNNAAVCMMLRGVIGGISKNQS